MDMADAVQKMLEGLQGEAFLVARDIDLERLCRNDGLKQHAFPLRSQKASELFRQGKLRTGPLSRQSGGVDPKHPSKGGVQGLEGLEGLQGLEGGGERGGGRGGDVETRACTTRIPLSIFTALQNLAWSEGLCDMDHRLRDHAEKGEERMDGFAPHH